MASKKFSISGINAEALQVTLADKSPEALYKELSENSLKSVPFFLITSDDASTIFLPLGNDLKGTKLAIAKPSASDAIQKLLKKWQKRKPYSEIFGAKQETVLKPHYLLQFAKDAATLKQLLQILHNDWVALYSSFFQIDEFCDSKKSQKREILITYLNAVLIDEVDEKQAKLYLEFKPPVFLNQSCKDFYIGNLYNDKNAIKKWKETSTPLKFLALLSVGADQIEKNAAVDGSIKDLLKKTEASDALTQELDAKVSALDASGDLRKQIQSTLLDEEKRDELIKKCAKTVKEVLRIPEGKREEFKQEIKKQAWLNCASLKASKEIALLDTYFKLDMYDGVISNLAISGGCTGIQYDHDFPDNLGGPNTFVIFVVVFVVKLICC